MSSLTKVSSLEQRVKAQFAREFVVSDWQLFKRVAEVYLSRATKLKIADVVFAPDDLHLLVRNIQKRLFIGIGVELLLKSLFLRHGFAINKPKLQKHGPQFPFRFAQARDVELDPADTVTLNALIQGLPGLGLGPWDEAKAGFRIAKVFRNKEGHVVVGRHRFDPQDYRDIEAALVVTYARGFEQGLHVRFSVAANEASVWAVGPQGSMRRLPGASA